jgi:hypothetical protein
MKEQDKMISLNVNNSTIKDRNDSVVGDSAKNSKE